jgi:flagellar protein FliS
MSYAANRSQEYLRNAVLTAAPEQLQLMLYDGAIRFATRGLEAICAKDREAAFVALERAQLIVLEMSNGIRREINPALADRMSSLYSYIYRRLIDANVGQDEQAVEDALRILRYERQTWLLLVEKLQKEAPAADDAPASLNAKA